jgi:regulator of replication initiation timing
VRVLGVLLALCSSAIAQETVDPAHLCSIQLVELAEENAKLRRELETLKFRMRYQLADGDQIDPATRTIKRAAKPKDKK